MAKKAKKSAKRGAKKAVKRSAKGSSKRPGKLDDLKPILDAKDTCQRITVERVGPGDWRVRADPTR